MRYRLAILGVATLAIGGCGEPPQMVPMTPPGVTIPRVADESAEALGESLSQGTIQPANVAPGAPSGSQDAPTSEPASPKDASASPSTTAPQPQ